MPKFIVGVRAQGFEVPSESSIVRGVYTTCFVEASTPLGAARKAFDILRRDVPWGSHPSHANAELLAWSVSACPPDTVFERERLGFILYDHISPTPWWRRAVDFIRERISGRYWRYREPFNPEQPQHTP